VEWSSLFRRDLIERAGLGEHEFGIQVGPGFHDVVAFGDAGEEGFGVGFNCEISLLHQGKSLACCEFIWLGHFDVNVLWVRQIS